MADIIFLKCYTLEQPLIILSSTFLNENIIFYVLLLFSRKSYKSGRNKDLFIEKRPNRDPNWQKGPYRDPGP